MSDEIKKRGRGHPVGVFLGKYARRPGGRSTRMYSKWTSMVARCTRPKTHNWKNYGGRGIAVCDRWLGKSGFDNFYDDMGECPAGLTLERKDNNLGYSKENCRWATWAEQALNRRKTGKQQPNSLRRRAINAGLPYMQVYFRVHRLHWTEERALTTPIHLPGRLVGWRKNPSQPEPVQPLSATVEAARQSMALDQQARREREANPPPPPEIITFNALWPKL